MNVTVHESTIGAVLLERAVILERLTFGAYLKGLESSFSLIIFSSQTLGVFVQESKEKFVKML